MPSEHTTALVALVVIAKPFRQSTGGPMRADSDHSLPLNPGYLDRFPLLIKEVDAVAEHVSSLEADAKLGESTQEAVQLRQN
jgi:hypothetical protein